MKAEFRAKVMASAQYQTRVVYAVARDYRPIHIVTGALLVAACAVAEIPVPVCAGFAALYIALEVLTECAFRRLPHADDAITLDQVVFLIGICICSSTGFMLPGLLLAQTGEIAYLIVGLIASFGLILHVTINYAPFQLFNLSQVLPALICLGIQLRLASLSASEAAQNPAWTVAFLGFAVFASNVLVARSRMHGNSRALRTARREARERLDELEYHAAHDTLTGLLNRRAFDLRINDSRPNRKARNDGALLLIDLNGFKPINDSYTHEAGDEVLREVARRIRSRLGEADFAARFGGDEFVIALPGATTQAAMALAASLRSEIAQPIGWRGMLLSVSASIGVTAARAGQPAAQLLSQADQAMYRAKATAEHPPCLFTPQSFKPRPTLNDRYVMQRALDQGAFVPFYQPKVDMRSGQIIGFEALARCDHGAGQIMLPGQFMPQLEELGLQNEFTQIITKHVLTDLREWICNGLRPGQVSINIPEAILATQSGRNELLSILCKFPDALPHVTLEITEDVFIARAGGAIRDSIRRLRDTGLRISLDDFGTGFASFRHLHQLEFDELKIDAGFVADLGNDERSDVLVAGLIAIARSLNVSLIAEGVENPAQRDALLSMGCDLAQGFLWDKALPADAAAARLAAQPYQRQATLRSKVG